MLLPLAGSMSHGAHSRSLHDRGWFRTLHDPMALASPSAERTQSLQAELQGFDLQADSQRHSRPSPEPDRAFRRSCDDVRGRR